MVQKDRWNAKSIKLLSGTFLRQIVPPTLGRAKVDMIRHEGAIARHGGPGPVVLIHLQTKIKSILKPRRHRRLDYSRYL